MPPIISRYVARAVATTAFHCLSSATHPSFHLHRARHISALTAAAAAACIPPRSSHLRPRPDVGRTTLRSLRFSSSASSTVSSSTAAHIAPLTASTPASTSASFARQSSSRSDEEEQRTNDDSSSSSSSSWSAWSFFAPFQRAFHWYLAQLNARPYTVQMLTSAFLFAIGDITAQHYEAHLDTQKLLQQHSQHHTTLPPDPPIHPLHHHTLPLESHPAPTPFSWHRLAAVTLFGLCVMGPAGHFWYSRLDGWVTRYAQPATLRFVGYKVLLDTVIFNPIFLVVFFSTVSLMEGLSWSDIRYKLYRDFVPSYAVDCSVWPIVQCFNFRFVSVNLQLLVVNLFCYFDDVFISYVQHNGMPALFVGIENAWLDYIGEDRKSGSGGGSSGSTDSSSEDGVKAV